MVGALAVWSMVPLAVLLLGDHDGVFNGSDGLQVSDHLYYLGLIRESGEHVLVSNRFDVVADPRLFLHPMVALSGLAWQLGASVQLAYLLWKPVAVLLLGAGFAAYVRRMFGGDRAAGLAALALALFFLTPATYLAEWLGADAVLRFGTMVVGLESYPAAYPWGGYSGTIGVALVPIALLGIERMLSPSARGPGRSTRWYAAWAGAAGMLSSWLHPWQGLTLLGIMAGLVAWDRFDRRCLQLAIPAALTALPLGYFFILSKTDSSWADVTQPNDFAHWGAWLVLGLAPAMLAVPGAPGRDLDAQERIVRLWPVVALLLYAVLQSSWFYHALGGLTLPLAVLAVRGWQRFSLPRAAAVAVVVALIVPGLVFSVQELRKTRAEHFLAKSERRALEYIDRSPRDGPVLGRIELGQTVPAFTGRQTYVGYYTWTPDNDARIAEAAALLTGQLSPSASLALLQRSRAAFVLADCRDREDLGAALGPLLLKTRRLGCATVYEVGRVPAASTD